MIFVFNQIQFDRDIHSLFKKMKLNTCEGVIWNKIRVFDTELQSNSMFYFPVNKNHDEFLD